MFSLKTELKLILVFLFLFTASNCAYADAPDPGKVVIDEINRMIPVLKNQDFRTAEEKEAFENSIIGFLKDSFDWPLIAERTLQGHWNDLTQKQREDFTYDMRILVQGLCLSAATRYNGQTAELVAETSEGNLANVFLKYISDTGEKYDVIVYLILIDDGWQVYDILAEGISLADNYKAQFKSIIENFSISKLLNMMTERSDEKE